MDMEMDDFAGPSVAENALYGGSGGGGTGGGGTGGDGGGDGE
jgi:hypothetical protein